MDKSDEVLNYQIAQYRLHAKNTPKVTRIIKGATYLADSAEYPTLEMDDSQGVMTVYVTSYEGDKSKTTSYPLNQTRPDQQEIKQPS